MALVSPLVLGPPSPQVISPLSSYGKGEDAHAQGGSQPAFLLGRPSRVKEEPFSPSDSLVLKVNGLEKFGRGKKVAERVVWLAEAKLMCSTYH